MIGTKLHKEDDVQISRAKAVLMYSSPGKAVCPREDIVTEFWEEHCWAS